VAHGRSRKQERTAEAEERTIFHFSFGIIWHLELQGCSPMKNDY
jgi:hypothetical protein